MAGILLLGGLLAWPLLLADSVFPGDGPVHLWFLWHQAITLDHDHLPSLFLNYSNRVFYPEYAFYGGTLFTLTGVVSLILGDAPVATFVIVSLLAFMAAHGGWYWLARGAGLGPWTAHVPGIVFVTSAYYLTLIYARGDWPEFIGVSMLPLLMGAGLSVMRADRLRVWPGLAFVASTVVFFGSHTLTMLWGGSFIVLTALVALACVPQARRLITRAGLVRLAGLAIPAVLVNAWYLLPALAYESHTYINANTEWEGSLRATTYLVSPSHLFTISRTIAPFPLSLPVVALAWVLVSTVLIIFMRGAGAWLRTLLIILAVTTTAYLLMTKPGFLLALPNPYPKLQFSYRLESYVLLGSAAMVLAVLVPFQGRSSRLRHWPWTVGLVLAVSLVGGLQQIDPSGHGKGRGYILKAYLTNPGAELIDYLDVKQPFLNTAGLPKVVFPASSIHGDASSRSVHFNPGQLVSTDVGGDSHFVDVKGAKIVGLDNEGNAVLRIEPAPGARSGTSAAPTEKISLSAADGPPIVLGRLLSLCAIIALVLQLGRAAVRSRVLRRETARS